MRTFSAQRRFSPQRTGAAAAKAAKEAKAALGDLPEWNLADLYASMDAPELKADIERAGRESEAVESRWKGGRWCRTGGSALGRDEACACSQLAYMPLAH